MVSHQEKHYLKGLEGLRNVDLLEEVYHLGWALRFQKSIPSPEFLPVSAYGPGCRTSGSFSTAYLPAYCHVPYHYDNELNPTTKR